MSETCAECKHSYPVDTAGRYKPSFGMKWDGHIHCRKSAYGTAHCIPANRTCTFSPSKWEPIAFSHDYGSMI